MRDAEIEGLAAHGLLDPAQRNDREVARALGTLIDWVMLSWWRVAARAGDRANYPDRYARGRNAREAEIVTRNKRPIVYLPVVSRPASA